MPICANGDPVEKSDSFSMGAKTCCLGKGATANKWRIGQQAKKQAGVEVYRSVEVQVDRITGVYQ